MAKDFAKKFYKSKAWRDCRAAYISKVHGLCERCTKAGEIVSGYILHHITELTPDNISNADIALGHDNLEFVCLTCHNLEHEVGHRLTATRDGLRFDSDGQLVEVDGYGNGVG